MFRLTKHLKDTVLPLLMLLAGTAFAQVDLPPVAPDSTDYGRILMKEQRKKWGPNDTILVPAIVYQNEIVNYKEEPMIWVSKWK